MTFVNGERITKSKNLVTGSRIILGNNHVFRFTDPIQGQLIYNFSLLVLYLSYYCYYFFVLARAMRDSKQVTGLSLFFTNNYCV